LYNEFFGKIMGSVAKLQETLHPMLSMMLEGSVPKKVIAHTSLLVSSMIVCKTANTMELANVLPKPKIKAEARRQIVWRYLKNEKVDRFAIMAPFARYILSLVSKGNKEIFLSMDQTEISSYYAILMIGVRCGQRALPVAWCAESGEANLGFDRQKEVLEQVAKLIPEGVKVILSADRFYPSVELIEWLKAKGWSYRLRLKKNSLISHGGVRQQAGTWSKGKEECYLNEATLFGNAVPTNIGIIHEKGHSEPWIIAMDEVATKESTLSYRGRWCIEPMFSDFKSRGFGLESSQLSQADRAERLVLIMAMSMYWCVFAGLEDVLNNPTYEEKKWLNIRMPLPLGLFRNFIEACVPYLPVDCAELKRLYNEMIFQSLVS
jgi:hypothetical protein